MDWGCALALRLDAESAWMALAVTVVVTALAWLVDLAAPGTITLEAEARR